MPKDKDGCRRVGLGKPSEARSSSRRRISSVRTVWGSFAGEGCGPIRWLLFSAVVLIGMIALGTNLAINQFRERALNVGKGQLESTAILLARHFDHQLEDLERVQKRLTSYMSAVGIRSPADFRRDMASAGLHLMLKAETSSSFYGNLNLLDVDGHLINWSQAWPAPPTDLSDRSYFRTLTLSADPNIEVVEPVTSRVSGAPKTLFSRKLNGEDGVLLGAVTRAMEPAQFEEFFASVTPAKSVAISLLHRDGTLLARHPHDENLVGQKFRPGLELRDLIADNGGRAELFKSSLDGEEKLISIQKIRHFPLDVVVTTTLSQALADWRAQTQVLVGIAIAFAGVIATVLLLILRHLSRQKAHLDTAMNNMTQGLILFDASQRVVICNRRYIDIYGVSQAIIKQGCTLREVIAHRKERGSIIGDIDPHCERIVRDMAEGKSSIVELRDGRSIQITDRPMDAGGWVSTHEDITERRNLDARLAHLAHYDALTDLPNRILLRDRLEQELERVVGGNPFAVIYIDLDEFKSVNDSLGHPVGDELLKIVATRLADCIREADFVARLGGDEFAIVQSCVSNAADVVELISRIHRSLREPADCAGHRISVDASIGVAMAPTDGSDIDQLLKNADIAMYGAKADGRRTFRFFEPCMDERVKARHGLELELRDAIVNDSYAECGLDVHYQPLVNLANGTITGFEALLRWRHPGRGVISPVDFVPIAEETGLINELGDWVLTRACEEATSWPDHLKVAVNVSPIQFRNETFALKVLTALTSSGLSAHRLELEVTEAVLIRDDAAALAILHELRAVGVRIALDDFGTGYSSLSYLSRFPFDKIKIDRCFVADIAQSACIIRAIVGIASDRGMTTTAEGVETEKQRDMLRSLGCTEMQGYLFSRPKSATEIRPLLLAGAVGGKIVAA